MSRIEDRLRSLADLFDKGLLTRAEFEEQKRRILSEPPASGTPPAAGVTPAVSGPGSAVAPPEAIGAYRVFAVVGAGGMGAVFRGRHRSEAMALRQGGDVAIKVMHPEFARRRAFQDRFEREAAMGLRLDHPGIVRVHDLISDAGTLALVMEWVEGRPLSDVIGAVTGPLPWFKARPLIGQLLAAVAAAHAQGVVHRDIKPDNALLGHDGQLKILDFGIAKDAARSGTRTGVTMGTVAYMAPEQYTDAKRVDARADLYALGMTLYEMLAGRLPWDADTPEFVVLQRKHAGDLPPPTTFYPGIPAPVVEAVMRALAPEPEARWADVPAFAAAFGIPLEGAVGADHASGGGRSVPAMPTTPAPRSTPPATLEKTPRSEVQGAPSHASTAPPVSPPEVTPPARAEAVATYADPLQEESVWNAADVERAPEAPPERAPEPPAQPPPPDPADHRNEDVVPVTPQRRAVWPLAAAGVLLLAGVGVGAWSLQAPDLGPSAREVAALREGLGAGLSAEARDKARARGCDAGVEALCALQGVAVADRRDALARRCGLGDTLSCLGAGLLEVRAAPTAHGDANAPRFAHGVRRLEGMCAAGVADACGELVDLAVHGRRTLPAAQRVADAQAGCEAGSPTACVALADLLREDDSAVEDDARALAVATSACEAGLSDGCVTAARIRHRGEAGGDPTEAVAAFTALCDQGVAGACYYLGYASAMGVGTESDPEAAREAYTRACAAGSPHACFELADRAARDGDDALALAGAWQACDGGLAVACERAATWAVDRGPPDAPATVAAWLRDRACRNGSAS